MRNGRAAVVVAVLLAAAVLIGVGRALSGHETGAPPAGQTYFERGPLASSGSGQLPGWMAQARITLHRPLHAPLLTRAEAIAVAKRHSPGDFGHSPVQVVFGPYQPGFSNLQGAVAHHGLIQVWLVHTAGLNLANPGGLPGAQPAPILHQSITAVSDDTAGVLAQAYSP